MQKKKILVAALAVCLVAILSMGSLAWFSDSDSVKNDFLIADSDDKADDIFSIDIYEEKDENGDGVIDENERTDVGFTYVEGEVLPNATLQKEAYVENTGKYDQYVRTIVTLSDVTVWKQVLGIQSLNEVVDLNEFFVVDADFDDVWHRNDADTAYDSETDTLTYVYYYNGVLKATDDAVNFIHAVKIPKSLNQAHVEAMEGSFDLTLKAEAIQTENILDTKSADEYQNAIDSFAAI